MIVFEFGCLKFFEGFIWMDLMCFMEVVINGVVFFVVGMIVFVWGRVVGLIMGVGMWFVVVIGLSVGFGFWCIVFVVMGVVLIIFWFMCYVEKIVLCVDE